MVLNLVHWPPALLCFGSQVAQPGIIVHARGLGNIVERVAGPVCSLNWHWGWKNRNLSCCISLWWKVRADRWRSKTLKDIIASTVIVPIVISGTLVLEAELKAPADHAGDVGVVDGKVKLVGESVARSAQVYPGGIRRRFPVVGGVADDNLFVEVQVDHADGAPDGVEIRHVSVLQTNFFVAKVAEKGGAAAGLVEEWSNGWCWRCAEAWQSWWTTWRLNREVKFCKRPKIDSCERGFSKGYFLFKINKDNW